MSAVLLDMTMPVITSQEMFSRMKEINPDVKVVLSSSYSDGGESPVHLVTGLAGFNQKTILVGGAGGKKVRSVLETG
jgi:hypothetical protein